MAIAEIHVVLKPTLFDAQGATVLKALHQLGNPQVRNVRIGKFITLEVDEAQSGPALEQQLTVMCQQLLANPVIEDYEITIDVPASASTDAEAVTPLSALSPSEQLAAGQISTGAVATPDPFAMDYDSYLGLAPQERLAMQALAWQKHSAWIRQQLTGLRAGWILCVGGQVIESGATLDSLPSEAHRDQLGRTRDLVPWVFTQPTSS